MGSYCNCGCGSRCGCRNISYGCNSSCSSSSSSAFNVCENPVCYVKANFVTPVANIVLEIEVTNSDFLYVGQGIKIGDDYYQIAAIADSENISIVHDGTATSGVQITAVQPSYGCYQYPLLSAGRIDRLLVPGVEGLDSSFANIPSSVLTPTTQITYGYTGLYEVGFTFQLDATIANTPRYVEVELPVNASGSVEATFSAMIDNGAGYVPAIAYRNAFTTFVVALDAATNLANGASKFRVTGSYGKQ